ncbi:fasciclin domain-containing protein [Methylibium sp.]|uniref:fasciclin domain-containing protein n=1 Tax=Methylibium sp. TaxID=2067992 RepID=UPI00286B8F56|nr:fasciclin domain-containing protein [Methylibium sp.]
MCPRQLPLLLTTSALWFGVAGCAISSMPTSIAETAATTPELSTWNRLITDAGMTETLRAAGPYTAFAPSDDAFKAVPQATLASLAKDKEQLKLLLQYHLVSGKVATADVKTGPAKTLQGANLALSKSGNFVTVDDAVVTRADMLASNGVVHMIDRVLVPPKR